MSDIFLCDEDINSNISLYDSELYRYHKLKKLYKEQISLYNKLIIELQLEIKKSKIILDNYNDKIGNIDKYLCKICFDKYCDCIVIPCMHFVCCENCINNLENNKCPICRNTFTKYMKLFT